MSRLFRKGSSNSGPLSGKRVTVGSISVNVHEKIAEGGFGQIYRATDSCNKQYALKSLYAHDSEQKQQIQKEYEIQKLLCSHPNIVDVYGIWGDSNTLILMEFCPGTLIGQMNDHFSSGFDDKTIVEVFQSVTAAVEFMHRHGISHRDLKPENVLQNGGVWKLCDFGSATKVTYDTSNSDEREAAAADIEKNTTALYRAPEMCDLYRCSKITTKIDVWALGCVLFKLCTFKDAFSEGTNLQILNLRYNWPADRTVNDKFKELVRYCFTIDPEERPTAREVLAKLHELFPSYTDSKWHSDAKPKSTSVRRTSTKPKRERVIANKEIKSDDDSDDDDIPIEFLPNSLRGRNASCGALPELAAAPPSFGSPLETGVHPTQSMPTFFQNQQQTSPPPGYPNQQFQYQPQMQMQGYGYQQPQMFSQEPFYQQPCMQPQQPGFSSPMSQSRSMGALNAVSPQPNFFTQMNTPQVDPFAAASGVSAVTPQVDPFAAATSGVSAVTPQVDPFAAAASGIPNPVQSSSDPFSPVTQESPPVQKSSVRSSVDAERIVTDVDGLIRELCKSDDVALSGTLEALASQKPREFPVFVLKLIHSSGTKANDIVKFVPKMPEKVFDDLIDGRVTLHSEFPQFEGNFSVNTYAKEHPVKPGEGPFVIDSVKMLQAHLTKAIQALALRPEEDVAAECFFCYQVTAFIMAKLKQGGINVGFMTASSIPLLKNQHGQIKRALTRLKTQPPFPAEPFNFDDENFLKRIRSPASKSLV